MCGIVDRRDRPASAIGDFGFIKAALALLFASIGQQKTPEPCGSTVEGSS
jgi:hypothetical protein